MKKWILLSITTGNAKKAFDMCIIDHESCGYQITDIQL